MSFIVFAVIHPRSIHTPANGLLSEQQHYCAVLIEEAHLSIESIPHHFTHFLTQKNCLNS